MQPNEQGGPPVTIEAVIKLLRDDRMRGFKIDVETDSLVEADQNAEKQRRVEFVTAVGEYLGKVGPLGMQMPDLSPLIGGMLQFAVRGFKVGSELEDLIEKTMDDIQAKLANPQPPQPDPETQAKLEGEKLKAQVTLQKAQMDAQHADAAAQAKMVEMQQSMQMEREKHQMEMAKMQAQLDAERERFDLDMMRSDRQAALDMEGKRFDIEAKASEREEKSKETEAKTESASSLDEIKKMLAKLSGKRKIVRGPDGSPMGIEEEDGTFRKLSRGADGKIEGLN